MSIAKIREVPRHLPPAALYLDDIDEIAEILLAAYAAHNPDLHPTVLYEFGGNDCDTQATSINDLKEIGGSVTCFNIQVGGTFGIGLEIPKYRPPEARLYQLHENEQRATFQKIEAIFRHRMLGTKNALLQLPSWLGFIAWVLNFVVPVSIAAAHASILVKTALWLMYAALFLATIFYHFQPSRVIFARSYERSRQQTETRWGYIRNLIFAVIGAVLTLLVQIILKKWFR